jgi:DNA-binding PadR family transcriptional regulator
MSNRELSPVSYLVLGLVACGAATSYELKQRVANSVGFMWSFPHSALYAEPPRLVGLGLLADEREDHGRRRRIYTITDQGRAELEAWLREPASEHPELRDLGLLKLFFSNLVDKADVRALAEAQLAAHRDRLALYERIEAEKAEDPVDAFPYATLRMGLMCERAFVAFWEEIAERPPIPDGALAPCIDGAASEDGLGAAPGMRTPAPSSTA